MDAVRPGSYSRANRDIIRVLWKPSAGYLAFLALATAMMLYGGYAWYLQILWGMGMSGTHSPNFWGVYIVTFVFWVGIGHAGTLISAILFLVRSKWRTGVYRASEAMTVFAVMTAALFPMLHLGRVWQVYWFFPYPNQRQLWVNFKSPLMWDVFAISTYFTMSAVFFYIGLIPDIAIIRDHTTGWKKKFYGLLAVGWRGTGNQWHHFMAAYGFFAAICAPLVLSVHSVVSWDFAMANTAGWHSTLFPPYFVAGAILSGCAMVITLLLPMTKIFDWEEYINVWHFESLAKMLLLTSSILSYSYVMELFIAWYSQNPYEQHTFWWRMVGPYAIVFWLMVFCNCVVPLVFWVKSLRRNYTVLFIASLFINVGMWMERYNFVISSQSRDFDPASWSYYFPSHSEFAVMIGSTGWFLFWFLLFVKAFPSIAIMEIKESIAPPVKGSLEAK
jgi:molybdopterin-containing oxidoreductase family membrane subunit